MDLYQIAVSYFENNNLQKAEEILNSIVTDDCGDYDALNLLGIISLHNKEFRKAIKYFFEVVQLNPSHYIAYYNLGLCLQHFDKKDEAVECYGKVLQIKPDYVDAMVNLSAIYNFNKKYSEAESLLRQVLRIDPANAEAVNNLGNIKLAESNLNEAIGYYKKAISLNPQNFRFKYNLATTFLKNENYEDALKTMNEALQLEPDNLEALNNLGIIYSKLENFDEAEKLLNKILAMQPERPDTAFNLAVCYRESNKKEKALSLYQKVVELEPGNKEAFFSLGELADELGEEEKANQYFNKVTDIKENQAVIFTNMALARLKQLDLEGALRLCRKALKIKDDISVTHYNFSHILLLGGNLKDGFKEYKWRKKRTEFKNRGLLGPELNTKDISNKRIYVFDEQGFGDSIQFVRYVKKLKELNCYVIFECDIELAELYSGLEYVDMLVPRTRYSEPEIQYDYQISVLDLPEYFNTDIETIPSENAYIKADSKLVSALSGAVKKDGYFNIGIVWAGNPNHTNDKNRSCSITNFKDIIELDGVRVFSLQKGAGAKQLENCKLPVINLDNYGLENFAQTAAIIENLDLVITVDTSVAHLAGALGKKVWVLLPYLPDWRWLLNRNDSPWYPNMKLFRQTSNRKWEQVFKQVVEEIKNLIENQNQLQSQSYSNELVQRNFTSKKDELLYLGLSREGDFGWGIVSRYFKKELSKYRNVISLDELPGYQSITSLNNDVFHAVPTVSFKNVYNIKGNRNIAHIVFENELKDISKQNSKEYDLILASSSWCLKKLHDHGIGNSHLLIQGYDPELFYPSEETAQDRVFKIYSGGKFELRKGQDLVLQAVKIMQQKYKDVLLINSWYNLWPQSMMLMENSNFINMEIKGTGWDEIMNNIYTMNGLDPDRIVTLPLLPNDEMRKIYWQSDIGLFPNRCEGGTNLVMMEYMACGKPVISSYNSGHRDILTGDNSLRLMEMNPFHMYDENKNLIADWEEPLLDEIVDKLEYAYFHREEIKTTGKNAAEHLKKFTWNVSAKNLIKYLDK